MFDILGTLISLTIVIYLLRWGYISIVKRQHMDWPLERQRFKQELKLMSRIIQRLTRYYLRGWHSK